MPRPVPDRDGCRGAYCRRMARSDTALGAAAVHHPHRVARRRLGAAGCQCRSAAATEYAGETIAADHVDDVVGERDDVMRPFSGGSASSVEVAIAADTH